MLIAARNAMMAGGATLPYDAEVEYLESTGTQLITLPVRMLPTDSCDAMVGSTATATTQRFLFGARKQVDVGWLYSGFRRLASSSTSNCQWAKTSGTFNETLGSFTSALQAFHLDYSGVSFGGVRGTNTLANAIDLEVNWSLFAVTSGVGSFGEINGGRIGSFSITRNGAKIIDLISVRVGTTGAMYDRRGVGGMDGDGMARDDGLYFNRGTGAFVIGPDK